MHLNPAAIRQSWSGHHSLQRAISAIMQQCCARNRNIDPLRHHWTPKQQSTTKFADSHKLPSLGNQTNMAVGVVDVRGLKPLAPLTKLDNIVRLSMYLRMDLIYFCTEDFYKMDEFINIFRAYENPCGFPLCCKVLSLNMFHTNTST